LRTSASAGVFPTSSRCHRLDEREARVGLEVVQDRAGEAVADPDAHVALWKDDSVGADAREDAAVRLRHRLCDDLLDAEVDENARAQDAGL
jgi:hypothetical protein